MENKITLTNHARSRAAKRGINPDQIKLCIQYGEELYNGGVLFFFMSDKCLKRIKKIYGAYLSNMHGLVVLTNNNDKSLVVVTVYKNRNALRDLKRKNKYKRSNDHAEYYC